MSTADLAAWVDKLAIRELLERYMRYNDDGDLDRILELFEPDAAYQVMGMFSSDDSQSPSFSRHGVSATDDRHGPIPASC